MPLQLREDIVIPRTLPRSEHIIEMRARFLAPEDRDLIEAVLIRGTSSRAVSRMMKVCPRTVRNRVHRLAKKLVSKEFMDAARALQYLPDDEARLARWRFCEGRSIREISERLGKGYHPTSKHLHQIAAKISFMADQSSRRSRRFAG
ncbi:MAG: hypothetical protein ACLFVU_03350 [Phycisphaerae bacterium]